MLIVCLEAVVGDDDDDDDDDDDEYIELDTSFLGKKGKNLDSNKLLCKYKQNACHCMHMYMCTHIHTHTPIHTYIHIYVNGYDNYDDDDDHTDDDDSVNN